ncbi:aminotransferase class I/II-fold pyridoxal phosphate-dependent enzyme [Hahella sp. KA22]|uniref:DegT/DnrJ/EryC1/StrS family aminotransferase n=1 Tax=Hahella sp. KA22 TaxID=1628392 RepID=UPI000FDE8631|nr:DegT/DnrJ/EryC1/StrS family aminotransferase [Hahella sp. KA22]AZZ91663.1 DegT/DnrJ/EryC1/StrS family aminotransferase [Hahella sp. KA22]QAY55033.1 aminotransferase class I/II-fold pyridoxal phosphate-dependent enzyme [Hahella sp. KA22]
MSDRKIQISLPSIGEEEWLACKDPLMSGWVTQGPKVALFEKAFAERHGVKHAIAVTSCTTALHLALVGLGIKAGDEVIVPAFTWVATANVVLYCGATPVLVDVDPKTFNIDIEQARARVTEKTRAVIAVHLFGRCADVDALREALPHNVAIVEDAACAAGAELAEGRCAGGLGDVAAFSFHPRKSITTGEGGMVTTNDSVLAERMLQARNHGASISEEQRHAGPRPYLLPEFNLLGFNYRMTDIQGAIGVVQLGKLDELLTEREHWAAWYSEQLADIDCIRTPAPSPSGRHGWQAYVLYIDLDKSPVARNELMSALEELGVSTRPGTHAVHMLGYYKNEYHYQDEDFPNARDCNNQTMAIPLHNRMQADDYQFVVQCIRRIICG